MSSTEIATQNSAPVATGGGALTLSPNQTTWSPEQLAVVRQLGLEQATREELQVFLHVCQNTGLDPFAKQIYGIMREVYNGVTKKKELKLTIQTGIDGFRLVASRPDRRTGEPSGFEGRVGPYWCGKDGIWTDVWLQDEHPYAAKCGVYKKGLREPIWATCLYNEYVQTKFGGEPNAFWASKPATMLGKCSEGAALRAAFPQDLSGVYAPEEMGHVAAEEMANRTVDASPMRSDEEQAQWDDMAAAERALDAGKLKVLYSEAAKAKNDLLVAAITAAGYRVRDAVAKKSAANEAADKLAAEQAADEPVDAVVVPDPGPPTESTVTEPKPLASSTNTALTVQLGRLEAVGPAARAELASELLRLDEPVADTMELTEEQARTLLGLIAQRLKRTPAAVEEIPLPDEPAR